MYEPKAEVSAGRARLLLLAAAVLALVATILILLRVPHFDSADLRVYMRGALAIAQRTYLYSDAHSLVFTYPPFAGVVFLPMTVMTFGLGAKFIVVSVSLVALAIAMAAAVRLAVDDAARAGRASPRRAAANAALLAAYAASLTMGPVLATLHLGQVNLVLMALILADLTWRPVARGRRLPQGVLIGVAAAVKLTPLIFIVYLALTRRGRAALAGLITFALAAALGFVVAPGASWDYWTRLVFQTGRVGEMAHPRNQSLFGAFARLPHGIGQSAWLTLPSAAIVLVGGVGLGVYLARRGNQLWGACAVGITACLVTPVSWNHHWVWVAPVLVALGFAAAARRSVGLWIAAAAWWLLFTLNPIQWKMPRGLSPVLRHALRLAARGCHTIAGLALLAGLAVWVISSLVRARRAAARAADVAPSRPPT